MRYANIRRGYQRRHHEAHERWQQPMEPGTRVAESNLPSLIERLPTLASASASCALSQL
jgi:hypothetical protein